MYYTLAQFSWLVKMWGGERVQSERTPLPVKPGGEAWCVPFTNPTQLRTSRGGNLKQPKITFGRDLFLFFSGIIHSCCSTKYLHDIIAWLYTTMCAKGTSFEHFFLPSLYDI